jgi:hypothetical protein
MLAWFNHNAAAVQALASVCSVIATVVLLLITRRYVGLTQELARAAREQLRFQERTAASEAAQLVTLVDVFLGSLKRFPAVETEGDDLRAVSLWKHSDVSAFGSLAASVLGTRPEVQRAIQRLNWIQTTAEHAQQDGLNKDNPSHEFPWEDWTRQIGEARTALQAVRGDAQSVEAVRAQPAQPEKR